MSSEYAVDCDICVSETDTVYGPAHKPQLREVLRMSKPGYTTPMCGQNGRKQSHLGHRLSVQRLMCLPKEKLKRDEVKR